MFSVIRSQTPRVLSRGFTTSTPALSKSLYVGNLSWTLREDDIKTQFAEFGEVTNVRIVMDRLSGRSRGFGFVDFAEDSAADVAAEQMNGKEIDGRPLTVNVSQPREEREPGSYQPRERSSYGDRRGGDDRRGGYGGGRGGGRGGDRGGYRSERPSYDRNDRGDRSYGRGRQEE